MMSKKSLVAMASTIAVVLLAACGSSTPVSETQPEPTTIEDDYIHEEGMVNINSNNSANKAPTAKVTTLKDDDTEPERKTATTPPETPEPGVPTATPELPTPQQPDRDPNQDPAGIGSESSKDAANFWRGDDFFDLPGYLAANGMVSIHPADSNYKLVEGKADMYYCYSSDLSWLITVNSDHFMAGTGFIGLSSADFNYVYCIRPTDINVCWSENHKSVQVDDSGTTTGDYTLKILTAVMEEINAGNYTDIKSTDYYIVERL